MRGWVGVKSFHWQLITCLSVDEHLSRFASLHNSCKLYRRSTNFFCTGNWLNPWYLAMVLRNFACISWDYTVLQTYLARCLVIVVCFRIFFKLYPYVVLRTHKNISREDCFLFCQKDSTGGRCGGLPEWSSHPAGCIHSFKKKEKKVIDRRYV